MEHQKIANFLKDESSKPSKFRTKNCVEINDDVRGVCSPNKQIRFKTSMSRSSLCDYSDAYILVKGNIVMPMYNLIEYSDNYSKKSGSLWQYCKETPAINNNGAIVDFDGANATDSFNFKTKITG